MIHCAGDAAPRQLVRRPVVGEMYVTVDERRDDPFAAHVDLPLTSIPVASPASPTSPTATILPSRTSMSVNPAPTTVAPRNTNWLSGVARAGRVSTAALHADTNAHIRIITLCGKLGVMAAVGADIESLCRKCGDVWHVVVAKVGDRIAKVQCKECGSLHKHRPVDGSKLAPARRKATKKRAAGSGPAQRIEKPTVEPDLSKPIRPYSIRDTFEAGERIDHPTFGIGVVEVSAEPGKMTVFFPQGQKVLAQGKPSSSLGPPRKIGEQ